MKVCIRLIAILLAVFMLAGCSKVKPAQEEKQDTGAPPSVEQQKEQQAAEPAAAAQTKPETKADKKVDAQTTPSKPAAEQAGSSEEQQAEIAAANENEDKSETGEKQVSVYATLSIKAGSEIIAENSKVELEQGDTALSLLKRFCMQKGLQIKTRGGYVSMLAGIAEFDQGPLSGWIYKINGTRATVGAANLKISQGDNIEWFYTKDLGKDVP